MASTRTLQDVARWAATFNKLVPIIGVGGFQSEPALTICNNVIQEMITAPFNWPFNSVDSTPFLTLYDPTGQLNLTPQQDYIQTVTDIQWIENATYTENLSLMKPQPTDILYVVKGLQKSNVLGPPEKLGKRAESDSGVTIRLWPVPPIETQWSIQFTYQRKAPIKQGLQETWGPFPDELAYVYNQGFLAMAYKQADDPRYVQEYAKFQVLMRQALGIEDMEGEGNGLYPSYELMMG